MNTRDSVMSDRQMAVFLVNWCKFRGCGLTFATLGELIQHIEEIHINNDPRALERQESQHPPSLPLSYILRVFTDAARKEKKFRPSSVSPVPSFESNTPTGSEFDEDEVRSEDEDSDDSWTTQEEFTSELILSMISGKDRDGEKPFACPVPGCKKRYKNVNGIKYHAKHGHKKEIRVRKTLRCHCGKSYKSIPGLRSHCTVHHPATDFWTILQRVKSPFHKHGAGVQHTLIAPLQLASMTHKPETQLATDSENLSLSSMTCQTLDPASLVSVPTAQTAVLLNQPDK